MVREDSAISTPVRVNILGVDVSAINMDIALNCISSWIRDRRVHYVCVTPAHSIMDAYYDCNFRRILNSSGLTTPDGMSIVWILKLLGQNQVDRVYGPDLMVETCCASVNKGWRHFFYGGEEGVAEKLSEAMKERFPGLQVVGTFSPPFGPMNPEEDAWIIAHINAAKPDIIWIGISSPKQEFWMASHLGKVSAPVLIGVGAAFDFLSGRKRQAPHWIQRMGLEWMFRFSHEPRRLWARYVQYPKFIFLVISQLLGFRHFS